MTRRPAKPPVNPYDIDLAWDELYDAQPSLPPPPTMPRRRRFRGLLRFLLLLLVLGSGVAGVLGFQLYSATAQLLRAIDTADARALEGRVDWPGLQDKLRTDLEQMAQDALAPALGGAQPSPGARAFLGGIIEATVVAERQPALLALTIQGRVFHSRRNARNPPLAEALGPVSLLANGRGAQLDFSGDNYGRSAGIGLCLGLAQGGFTSPRLLALAWPERGRRC